MNEIEIIKENIAYNPDTGYFFRLKKNKKDYFSDLNKAIGWINGDGYLHFSVEGKTYKAHRVAFVLMNGKFPDYFVDHVNGVRNDNRWLNLREASHSQNNINVPLKSNNKSGYKGVHKQGKKYISQINFNGKNTYLGSFDNPIDAHNAYKSKAIEMYGEFSNI